MIAPKYAKPALTFEQQVTQLLDRGLGVADRAAAEQALACISYYRLSAYWHPFKRADNTFEPGATFEQAVAFYEFDRRFRLLVLDAVERFEVHLRTAVTYHLGHTYGAFAHIDPKNFHEKFGHAAWLESLHDDVVDSKEKFVEHYKRSYDGFPALPIWMATELMSLGALSRLYRGMKPPDRRSVSVKFDTKEIVLMSWAQSLTYVRNTCAHHGRLWNRELAVSPEVPRDDLRWHPPRVPSNKSSFFVLLMLRHLTRKQVEAGPWADRVEALLSELNGQPRWQNAMGLPLDWKEHVLWKR